MVPRTLKYSEKEEIVNLKKKEKTRNKKTRGKGRNKNNRSHAFFPNGQVIFISNVYIIRLSFASPPNKQTIREVGKWRVMVTKKKDGSERKSKKKAWNLVNEVYKGGSGKRKGTADHWNQTHKESWHESSSYQMDGPDWPRDFVYLCLTLARDRFWKSLFR